MDGQEIQVIVISCIHCIQSTILGKIGTYKECVREGWV